MLLKIWSHYLHPNACSTAPMGLGRVLSNKHVREIQVALYTVIPADNLLTDMWADPVKRERIAVLPCPHPLSRTAQRHLPIVRSIRVLGRYSPWHLCQGLMCPRTGPPNTAEHRTHRCSQRRRKCSSLLRFHLLQFDHCGCSSVSHCVLSLHWVSSTRPLDRSKPISWRPTFDPTTGYQKGIWILVPEMDVQYKYQQEVSRILGRTAWNQSLGSPLLTLITGHPPCKADLSACPSGSWE